MKVIYAIWLYFSLFGIPIILFFIFMEWVHWKVNLTPSAPTLSFSTFLHFYQIAPQQWVLKDGYVMKHKPLNFKSSGLLTSLNDPMYIVVDFKSYKDLILYRRWVRRTRKERDKNIKDFNTAQLIKTVQNDLADYDEKWKKWMKGELGDE